VRLPLLSVLLAVGLLATAVPSQAASRADWLARAQNRDGGFGAGPGVSSSQLMTGWAALGLAAAGRNPLDVRRGGRDPISAMRRTFSGVRDVGGIQRTILVLRSAGLNPRAFAGRNLVREVLARQTRDGSIAGYVSYTSFGVLAWRASGVPRGDRNLRRATGWILRQQNADGGWNVSRRGRASGVDDTSYAIQALVAAGRRSSRAVARGAAFLTRRQNSDGGFPIGSSGASNAQSTAYAVQGLVAAGRRLPRRGGRTPLRFLATLTEPSGRVRYSRTSAQTPVWVTAQVLLAMARKPFPLRPVRRR
jgi:energy-coupling factor transport system substrate-specific component